MEKGGWRGGKSSNGYRRIHGRGGILGWNKKEPERKVRSLKNVCEILIVSDTQKSFGNRALISFNSLEVKKHLQKGGKPIAAAKI